MSSKDDVASGEPPPSDDSAVQIGDPGPTQTEICGDAGADAAGCPGLDDPVDAFPMAKGMGFGANIGNTPENTKTWETGWGQPRITRTFIDGTAS